MTIQNTSCQKKTVLVHWNKNNEELWYPKNKCCRFVVVCSFFWGKKIFVAGASQWSRLQAFNFLKCLRAMIVFTVMITSIADTVIGPQSGNVHFAHGPWNLKACCFVNDQGSAGPKEQITVSSREKQVFSRITGRAKWGSKDRQRMSAWVKPTERTDMHEWVCVTSEKFLHCQHVAHLQHVIHGHTMTYQTPFSYLVLLSVTENIRLVIFKHCSLACLSSHEAVLFGRLTWRNRLIQ